MLVSFPKVFSFPTDLNEKVGLSDKYEKQNMQCTLEKRKYSAVVSNWPCGQEPIQLPQIRATAFLQVSLFLDKLFPRKITVSRGQFLHLIVA